MWHLKVLPSIKCQLNSAKLKNSSKFKRSVVKSARGSQKLTWYSSKSKCQSWQSTLSHRSMRPEVRQESRVSIDLSSSGAFRVPNRCSKLWPCATKSNSSRSSAIKFMGPSSPLASERPLSSRPRSGQSSNRPPLKYLNSKTALITHLIRSGAKLLITRFQPTNWLKSTTWC